ncbi:unnamed protein product, partial [Adineta ricciae]
SCQKISVIIREIFLK